MLASKHESLLIIFLLLTLLLTGCTALDDLEGPGILSDLFEANNNANSDNKTQSNLNPYPTPKDKEVLSLEDFSLNPAKVLEGKLTSITATVANKGKEDVIVFLGNNGRYLLQNYCQDLFTLEDYKSELKSQTRGVKQVSGRKIILKPSERLESIWKLRAEEVPTSYSCSVELKRSYQYSVRTEREVQIKQSESVKSAEKSGERSGRGAVGVKLELDKSSYLAGETIYVQVVLKNEGDGTADIKELTVNYPQLTGSCDLPHVETMKLSAGDKKQFRCVVSQDELDVPSQMYRISARARYRYNLESEKSLKIIK